MGGQGIGLRPDQYPLNDAAVASPGRTVAPATKKVYCSYCKRQTVHEIHSLPNKEGTGGKLVCSVCGSARLDTIQGFDASLM